MPIRSNRKTETYYDQFSTSGDVAQSPYPWIFPFGDRALFLGGFGGTPQQDRNDIGYVNITTTGDAADFGSLLAANKAIQGCSNAERGIVGGGSDSPNNIIQYNTIATLGNSIDFGDLTQARVGVAAGASKTRGVFAGGQPASPGSIPGGNGENTIDYVTIATTGDATDFGDIPYDRTGMFGSSNGTVMIIGGGDNGNEADDIARLTIATTGNAVDFGSLDSTGSLGYKAFGGAASDATRWVIGGGRLNQPAGTGYRTDQIEYVNYGNYTNSSDFGDLVQANYYCTGTTSNSTRAVISGGDAGGTLRSYIYYVTIQTTGDATQFGDLYGDGSDARRGLHAAYSGQA
tara:strand:- start:334 stop:1371 length:1038 start_codon:yes stop_codon:yes gene_type:complete